MKNEMNFEMAMQRLGEINTVLERGEVSLEDSIKLYAEGTKLSAWCYKKLDTAKQEIIKIENSVEG